MKLLVGLGNPGPNYQGTRHNIGFDAVACLVRQFGLGARVTRFGGWFGSGRIDGETVSWLCPQTFMNLSGNAVGEAVRFYHLEPVDVVVFHDDLDLAPGRIKVKQGGGHGGHNGLKSIHQVLASPEFLRVRLGIGRPPGKMDPARYVLEPFSSQEQVIHDASIALLPQVLPFLLRGDPAGAMNHLGQIMTQQPNDPRKGSGNKKAGE
ncbi:MAG: aminoacyl-tRNA hydrolase [Magnetococcales bacterium]|nr:aminoacyl-tRNA hydrolase [Magnetococcales bacterium]